MLREEFISRNNKLQQEIKLEIRRLEEGIGNKNIFQLQIILKELQYALENPKVPLSYPRFIIDSWDYSDQLGVELLELAELYKKIKI